MDANIYMDNFYETKEKILICNFISTHVIINNMFVAENKGENYE